MATKRINFTTLNPTSLLIISNYHKAQRAIATTKYEANKIINEKKRNAIEKYRQEYESYHNDILNGHSLLDNNIYYAYCLASLEGNISKTGILTAKKDDTSITITVEKSFKQSVQTFLENIGAKNVDNNNALEKFSSYMLANIEGFISAKEHTKFLEQYTSFINEKQFKEIFFVSFFHYVIDKYNIFEVKSDNSINYKIYTQK